MQGDNGGVQGTVRGERGEVEYRVGAERSGGKRRQMQSVTDPCAGMPAKPSADESSYYVPPSALRACLDTVPLDSERVGDDITSVKLYFQNFYGSLKVGQKSPSYKVPSYYDVVQELNNFLGNFTNQTSSPRAYEKLYQIIYKLHDGHTFLNYGWQIKHL